MSSQLSHCYAYNRRSQKTVDLYITSLDGSLGSRMDTAMRGVHRKWPGVEVSSDAYETVLNNVAKEDLVYLTADSDNMIQSLDKNKVYIIGGIVDKNRYKVRVVVRTLIAESLLQQGCTTRDSTRKATYRRLYQNGF
jgi:tRNA (guanine9-N1)-methyltransferase